jgi:hypothetical protein
VLLPCRRILVEGSTSSGVGGGFNAGFGASALAPAGTGLADAGFDRKVHLLKVESAAGRWRRARRRPAGAERGDGAEREGEQESSGDNERV